MFLVLVLGFMLQDFCHADVPAGYLLKVSKDCGTWHDGKMAGWGAKVTIASDLHVKAVIKCAGNVNVKMNTIDDTNTQSSQRIFYPGDGNGTAGTDCFFTQPNAESGVYAVEVDVYWGFKEGTLMNDYEGYTVTCTAQGHSSDTLSGKNINQDAVAIKEGLIGNLRHAFVGKTNLKLVDVLGNEIKDSVIPMSKKVKLQLSVALADPWECYRYTPSEQLQIKLKVKTPQQLCGFSLVYTNGNNAKYPGCGECVCCTPTARECKTTATAHEYRGTKNVTINGLTCQRWDSNVPHTHANHRLDAHENYCRNPGNNDKNPFCYTTDKKKRWELCDVPFCVTSGLTPYNCVAKNSDGTKIYKILDAGCGDGVIFSKDQGFTTTSTTASSPYFKVFQLFETLGNPTQISYKCEYATCRNACDGSSCALRRKRSVNSQEHMISVSTSNFNLQRFDQH